MKKLLAAISIMLITSSFAMADAGVLEPTNVPSGNRSEYLKLRKMEVHVTVEDQHAFVSVLQLYENLTNDALEGKYVFRIPEGAAITDFAIWEDGTRIPGVILERRKARRIYEELTTVRIDPGLLEAEEDEEERNAFVVRVFPIPARGVKRLELCYEQPLDVTSLRSQFVFPLKPDVYEDQSAENIEVTFTLKSAVPIETFNVNMENAEFQTGQGDDGIHFISRTFKATNFEFIENIDFNWKLKVPDKEFDLFAYRDTERQVLDISPDGGQTYRDDTGYFLARVTFGLPEGGLDAQAGRRDIVFALDASVSMQGRKLEAAFNTISDFMGRLTAEDRFGLVLLNDEVAALENKTAPATAEQVEKATTFIRRRTLTGGTDIIGGLAGALDILGRSEKGRNKLIVLITDGNPTENVIAYKKFLEEWKKLNKGSVRLYIFGIGNDANAELLEPLAAQSDGYFAWADETEDLEFKLSTFFDKVGAASIGDIKLKFSDPSNFTQVYPADPQKTFAGSAVEFVGKYLKPASGAEFTAEGEGVRVSHKTDLPEKSLDRPWIRRVWAKARVAYLLYLIRYEGEKAEWVEEIIALAKEFKFVTPYTSFLAAPRALLRPRVIKPGDPILRVRTDQSVTSVTAVFPFGLIKKMRRVEVDPARGDVWETRFLAPKWMTDGSYECTLILFDSSGRAYRETKQFVIDSHPPTLKVSVPDEGVVAGGTLEIRVDADPDTRWIKARIPGLPAVDIRWDPAKKISGGSIPIPPDFAPGNYEITVSAEDFAHNTAARSVPLAVRGGAQ